MTAKPHDRGRAIRHLACRRGNRDAPGSLRTGRGPSRLWTSGRGICFLLGGPAGDREDGRPLASRHRLVAIERRAPAGLPTWKCPPRLLAERIVSRLSSVPLTERLRIGTMNTDERERVKMAVDALAPIADRLAFMGPPFALEHVAAAADVFAANVLILDYLQRFTVGTATDNGRQARQRCYRSSPVLRWRGRRPLRAGGDRQKNASGSTYRGLNLASFRGSSELEFGADSCYLLIRDAEGPGVMFACEKNRYGPTADIATVFDPTLQTFGEAPRANASGTIRRRDARQAGPRKSEGGMTCAADLKQVKEDHGGNCRPMPC